MNLRTYVQKFEDLEHDDSHFFRLHPTARYYLKSLSNPPRPKQFEYVQKWQFFANEDDRDLAKGLILSGGSGNGKTTALYVLLRRLFVEESEDVLLIDGVSLINTLSDISKESSEYDSIEEYFSLLSRFTSLAIDDLDKVSLVKRDRAASVSGHAKCTTGWSK